MESPLDCWSIDKLLGHGEVLLKTGQWSDCQFVLGEEPQQEIVKCHKVYLAKFSPVFEAMFFGVMAETSSLIPIKDIQPEVFKIFLKYMYTDKVELDSLELAFELCYCAQKYIVTLLVEECMKYVHSKILPENACRIYEFARLFDDSVIMDKCMYVIRTNTVTIFRDPSWEDVQLTTVLTILEQNELQISSEIELFRAVERWAKSECRRKSLDPTNEKSMKSVVGNALSKIRFLSLTAQEFANGPGVSPLLTRDESSVIFANILKQEKFQPFTSNKYQKQYAIFPHKQKNQQYYPCYKQKFVAIAYHGQKNIGYRR
ncbi:BTB/POZ domain-containing protein 6-A-like [Pseudomyrmex gracilis]|uniref:BTB/POZ domain-containing protein 6-A-like n=1 Tax=Pseudomyrmex gracilis TaxID=219809 RepID=UPI000995CD7F|nr:BTB/POZ domain-containing protein 6-A-like [Pseudomyrmex gracilis]